MGQMWMNYNSVIAERLWGWWLFKQATRFHPQLLVIGRRSAGLDSPFGWFGNQ
jgi:hypothetical protein